MPWGTHLIMVVVGHVHNTRNLQHHVHRTTNSRDKEGDNHMHNTKRLNKKLGLVASQDS